ncbi:polyribonucleotide nucleotidyltransferase [Gynuella sunshinyii]|uniref:Polyribonucleotide nucleotidyltransferase n=1 Tax=Gynuella sunshinyii YC6258 TaxID=1445510 RepID=A0A0C5VRN0_9GAMM|nr:polyribonucleotide nucleotidyltransferase [Gynuella sunshinyii]AJQ97272.1 polyribonucleotide nucleotidyltransferase (polynucleotide phosphorylase) [Gynuella sunshinyii YC6258]
MSFLTAKTKTFQYGIHTVTLETGKVARQATGAVIASMGESKVLATVVAAKEANPAQDFFPLSVHYQEKYYAIGKIPGGYLKREGRPSEKETLVSRLIDRPIRPLFPKGFMNEVQVIINVISASAKEETDICAMLATSAALAVSGIPFNGPIGAARVSYSDDHGYILNPDVATAAASSLDMVVAGTKDAVLMVESEAKELTEDQMLGAVLFAHMEMQPAIKGITEFASEAGKEKWDWQPEPENTALLETVSAACYDKIAAAYTIVEKAARYDQLTLLRNEAIETLSGEEEGQPSADDIKAIFGKLEKKIVRRNVVEGKPRIDGRDNKTVRPIEVEVGVLPRAHGSALFTRGETQALVSCTLGTKRDAKMEEDLTGLRDDYFMLHYNFPPFSVGECGRMGAVGRREVGHGRLARRGVQASMPSTDDFPYSVRVVSEITESNGSSSMASVCGSSLALMDAGVPVSVPVAGIAMGLVKESDGFAVLTDILGDEDHLGDMDFKVAGSAKGVTALQMDIKIEGITEEIMEIALQQAHEARIHILGEMSKVISAPRPELSPNAPANETVKIDAEKIRDVIGKGGATIRALTEETGTEIDIDDDGTIRIYAPDGVAMKAAKDRILAITAEAEIGKIYKGTVARLADFGAFVTFLPGKDGLVHISQIAEERIKSVADVLKEGQEVVVKVLDIDNRGRIKLTMKEISDEEKASV